MTLTKQLATAVRTSCFGIAALTALMTVPSAFGAEFIKANVPFAFQVGSKTLPAGAYEFKIDRQAETVQVTGGQPRDGADVLIMCALAAMPHSNENHIHIVFDKVGTTYTLSELWEPGADGVLVHATKGKHEHHVLHVKRPT